MDNTEVAEVSMVYASEIYVYCPHCGVRETGFCGNIKGDTFNCCSCGEKYSIHADCDVELEM